VEVRASGSGGRSVFHVSTLTGVRLSPGGSTEAGPCSVPEEDHSLLGLYGRDFHQVPLLAFTSIKRVLDLLSSVSALVAHQFLGKVPSMLLLYHEPSFPKPTL
jgi:hypothetical protein